MEFGLTGKTALVVRAGEEPGSSCAQVLAAEGATVVAEVGDGVDIVVAHGGPPGSTRVLDCDSAAQLTGAWGGVEGVVDTYRRALPGMTGRGWGRLVWVGTATAKSLDAGDDELGALASLSVMAVHKVIAAEVGPAQVTANTVLQGGGATAADVASTVAFLCSEGAGYLTGVTVTVDGGAGSAVF